MTGQSVRSAVCCRTVLAFLTMAVATSSQAGIYEFTNVVDTTMHGFTGFGFTPAMNDSGTIAFEASRAGDGAGIYTIDSSGHLTTIARTQGTSYRFLHSHNSITNDGRVLFRGSYQVSGIDTLIGNGVTTTIVERHGPRFDDVL